MGATMATETLEAILARSRAELMDPVRHAESRDARVELLLDIFEHPYSPTKNRADRKSMIEDFIVEHEGDVLLTDRGLLLDGTEYVLAKPESGAGTDGATMGDLRTAASVYWWIRDSAPPADEAIAAIEVLRLRHGARIVTQEMHDATVERAMAADFSDTEETD